MMRALGGSHEADAHPGGQDFVVEFRDCRGDESTVDPRTILLQGFLEVACPRCGRTFYVQATIPEVVPRAAASA